MSSITNNYCSTGSTGMILKDPSPHSVRPVTPEAWFRIVKSLDMSIRNQDFFRERIQVNFCLKI